MSISDFQQTWDSLGVFQKKAAEWSEGALLVLAGPGSGKTRVLTCHIAKLLNESRDKNFRILGLTFTNKAADEMRIRVSNYAPGLENRLFLGTFHSFCADILRQHGSHLGIKTNFTIYSQDNDLEAVLNDAVECAKKESELISDFDKKTLPVIQRLKSNLILPNKCAEMFGDVAFGQRISIVYKFYERLLDERNALDFNSLLLKAYLLLTKYEAFAKRYRTVYSYICIDEFQDANKAQYQFIRAFTGDQYRNLFIVADDDQIIYQWNGASHKRIEELINDFSPQVIQLPMNYRCPAEVVKLANLLISNNFLRSSGKKPLNASKPTAKDSNVIRLLTFSTYDDEALGIAQDIIDNHFAELGSAAILARNRRLLEGVLKQLQRKGISAIISQRKNEFESTPFRWLNSILRLASDTHNRVYLEAVCGTFYQLSKVKIEADDVINDAQTSQLGFLHHWIRLTRSNADDSTKVILDNVMRYLVEGRDFKKFSDEAINWFNMIEKTATDDPTLELFARFKEELDTWGHLMQEIIAALGDEITLEGFLQELQMHSKERAIKPNTVVLMTIHGAKGKEFDHVYLVGLVDDELPSFQSKKKGDMSPEMEEERRNCFVAITRAVKTLTISYATNYWGWQKEPSRFLYEMGLLQ